MYVVSVLQMTTGGEGWIFHVGVNLSIPEIYLPEEYLMGWRGGGDVFSHSEPRSIIKEGKSVAMGDMYNLLVLASKNGSLRLLRV